MVLCRMTWRSYQEGGGQTDHAIEVVSTTGGPFLITAKVTDAKSPLAGCGVSFAITKLLE